MLQFFLLDFGLEPTQSSSCFCFHYRLLFLLQSPELRSHFTWLSEWKVEHFLLLATSFHLVSWLSWLSGFLCLAGWSWTYLLFLQFTWRISSTLMALSITLWGELPNSYLLLSSLLWTSRLESPQHFTCMADSWKHSKFNTNFWSFPTKFVPPYVRKWQLHSHSYSSPKHWSHFYLSYNLPMYLLESVSSPFKIDPESSHFSGSTTANSGLSHYHFSLYLTMN